MSQVKVVHLNEVLHFDKEFYQGICSCGWSSTIDLFETVDLLRAMHAHSFAIFHNYT